MQEKGASFNTLGKLGIAEEVLEEVVQNALVHRDLLRPAPVRIFIFDNRVEVISSGALAGGLTEDDIRSGKTYQRNPYMAIFATNALYYRGIGSGIVRILAEYPDIQLDNDDNAKEFKVTIWRTTQKSETTIQKNLDPSQAKVLEFFSENPHATIEEAAEGIKGLSLGGVKFVIGKLQQKGLLKRVGERKHGEWQVLI